MYVATYVAGQKLCQPSLLGMQANPFLSALLHTCLAYPQYSRTMYII